MRNYLFQGNPGTGKTYFARAAGYYLCQQGLEIGDVFSQNIAADMDSIEAFVQGDRCAYIQVHAAMGYEDIVYGPQIHARGSLSIAYAEKRIKALCDRAMEDEALYCVILDDISRNNVGTLLGNLLYAMEYRNEAVSLGDGQFLTVPENVIFLITESTAFLKERLDFALRRRMDYVKELVPSEEVLDRYYTGTMGEEGKRLICGLFSSVCRYIDRTIASEYQGRERAYYPGHGMFLVPAGGTEYGILDSLGQKLTYQVVPHLRDLQSNGILTGDVTDFCETLKATLNTGVQGLNRILSVQKILVNAGAEVAPYSLEDTKSYYRGTIIPAGCSDYRDMLESVIDGILLNGIFPLDMVFSALLMNTDIAAVPSKAEEGQFASYLVSAAEAADYYYETPRNGGRVPHQYYSANPGRTGRWAAVRDAAAYRVMYRDREEPVVFRPLNGVRLHTFTTENVCKANNPAEIYGAIYRLLDGYLTLYGNSIGLLRSGGDCQDLYDYILLEQKYLAALNRHLNTLTAGNQAAREKARIACFGTKILGLNTVWQACGAEILVSEEKFRALVQGDAPLTVGSFEELFLYSPETAKSIKLKGVVKMVDLRDYQAVMENIGIRQMIFQGPPGTSKTFESKRFVLKQLDPGSPVLADAHGGQEEISRALEGYKLTDADYRDPANSPKKTTGGWDLVQFHPSYGYEDFIRGIEVRTANGVPTYATVNRILGKIAEFAKIAQDAAPGEAPKFYLLIDEINRANLATVFGELIYGLEYRDSKVSTPYEVENLADGGATKDIVLGRNLFIIGTMNTADKSIDAIDYAIRRRFLFIDSPADRNVVRDCYQRVSGNQDERSIELLLFDAVQAVFDDDRYFNPDYQKNDVRLGHTYFLRKKAEGYADDVEEHVVFQIIPILREYVKDGILDTYEDLIQGEHSVEEIFRQTDEALRTKMIADNIMAYAKEFGNVSRFGTVIDNRYVGVFVERLIETFGY